METIFCEKCGELVKIADYTQHAMGHFKENTKRKTKNPVGPTVLRCEFCDKTYTSEFIVF